MAKQYVSLVELEATRENLVKQINASLTKEERAFLLSFKRCAPDWSLLGLTGIDQLPAVRWKLLNLTNMHSGKRQAAYDRLQTILNG